MSAAALGGLTLVPRLPALASTPPLKVAVYGGFFKKVLDKELFGPFQKETGIPVESHAEPTGPVMLQQVRSAVKAGKAPVDVAIFSVTAVLRGLKEDLWAPYSESEMPNLKYLASPFIRRDTRGRLVGIGALSWYINLVYNYDVIKYQPDSYKAFWDPRHRDQLGLLKLVDNSFLLEITATTYFGGKKILDTKQGILRVMKKLAEVKPNVKMWYESEATFEQALKTGEVPMGQLYHDVTTVMASKGAHVRSVFPREGGVLDHGEWMLLRTSKKAKEAHIFVNYCCDPKVQDRVSMALGTSPTVNPQYLSLSKEDYEKIAGPGPEAAITPYYKLYIGEIETWLKEKWNEMIIG
ncbi:MAG: extracellular solute-binding protein [Deltaproteobacteria bacterium]|nr:extracellular solute-binding protein [Deltaproteobacteria bacterium]MBW2122749.1 extracellular solute-binding protein [Deltaproteobacteria bacterium]